MAKVVAFLKDQSGETSIEYSLVAVGIAAAMMVALVSMGPHAFR